MARIQTPQDAFAIVSLIKKQATGESALTAVNSSNFVSVGETILATGTENTMNALGVVLGRTLMAVRPYKAKLAIINALNTGAYTHRLRKISYYSREATNAGDWNTNLYTNLKTGYTNGQNTQADPHSTKSQWEQNMAVPLEMNFGGQSVWQDWTSVYEEQLKVAFRSPDEFMRFANGIMTEKANDIESEKEAFNRMVILNHMAGIYDLSASMPNSAINLTAGFNTKFGTNYTSADLRTTYLESFLKYFVTEFKLASDYMTNRSVNYHWSPAKTIGDTSYTLLRHTPKDKQRAMLFNPLFTEAKANVYASIFNPQYLDLDKSFEPVDYWQSINTPAAISVTPAIPDVSTGVQKAGNAVSIPYVVGMLYDEDALMVDYQLESARSTPVEARKGYRNIWWSFSKNAINDFTENAVLFYMAD